MTRMPSKRTQWLLLAALLAALYLLSGCSAEKQIATSSTSISGLAHSSRGRFVEIVEQADSGKPDIIIIRQQAQAGMGEQSEIIEAVAAIVASLPGVADTSPWWADMIARILVVAAIVAAAVLLIQSGALTFLRGWLLKLRPRDRHHE